MTLGEYLDLTDFGHKEGDTSCSPDTIAKTETDRCPSFCQPTRITRIIRRLQGSHLVPHSSFPSSLTILSAMPECTSGTSLAESTLMANLSTQRSLPIWVSLLGLTFSLLKYCSKNSLRILQATRLERMPNLGLRLRVTTS